MIATQQNINGWILEKTLGSGGFGAVYLFRHDMTSRYVAVKQCRQQDELSERTKSRWALECEIMLQLDHPNIVKGLPLPEELSQISNGTLPVLAMEFCEMGDLRKVLNRPENPCGLPEYQVRTIAKDISSAVEYLHSRRIIHRDLKPENVVMHKSDSRIYYKLIDLGYAKDLAKDSVCTSFVGTLQYLAPELFSSTNPKYTRTVDYWSLGNTIFECITGYRPFLHHAPPIKWLEAVSNKKPNHICALFDESEKVAYLEKLPKPNRLCSLSQTYFEQWLRLLLQFDPKSRGGEAGVGPEEKKRPKCFELLNRIMNTKLIHIYSVPTNDVLSYPTMTDTSETTVEKLSTMLHGATNIDPANQELITLTGMVAELDKESSSYCAELVGSVDHYTLENLVNTCKAKEEESLERDRTDLFLFSKYPSEFSESKRKVRLLPKQVQMVLNNRDKENVYMDQVQTSKYLTYYCTEIAKDFSHLIEAFRAASLCLMREKATFFSVLSQLRNDCSDLEAKMEMFEQCVSLDIQELLNQKTTTGTFSQKMLKSWELKQEEVSQNSNLKEQMCLLEGQSNQINMRVLELQRSPFTKDNLTLLKINRFPEEARKIYEELRALPHDQRHKASKTQNIVRCLQECTDEWGQLSKDLYIHLNKIMGCRMEMQRLRPNAAEIKKRLLGAKENLLKYQRQRQKDIWGLLTKATSQIMNSGTSPNTSRQTSQINGDFDQTQYSLESLRLRDESMDVRRRLRDIVEDLSTDSNQSYELRYDWSFMAT